jgi:hypothetical protein
MSKIKPANGSNDYEQTVAANILAMSPLSYNPKGLYTKRQRLTALTPTVKQNESTEQSRNPYEQRFTTPTFLSPFGQKLPHLQRICGTVYPAALLTIEFTLKCGSSGNSDEMKSDAYERLDAWSATLYQSHGDDDLAKMY